MARAEGGIGDRIELARKAKGLSARQLARQVGISHTAINKYRSGLTTPSSDILIRLSGALGVSIEYLLRPFTVRLEKVEFRKKASLSRADQHRLEARVQDELERLLALEEFLPADEVRRAGLPTWPCANSDEAEKAAETLRKEWRLGDDAIRDLTTVIEDHGVRVFNVRAPQAFDGLSGIVGKEVFIAIGSNWAGDRQRLTLGHELGHLLMQMLSHADSEKLCFRFAGAFLLPAERVRAELSRHRRRLTMSEVQRLKDKYGISMQAVLRRALDLAIISPATYREWVRFFKRQGWAEREPGPQVPSERPHWKRRLLQRLLAEDLISEARAAEIADLPVEEIRELGAGIEEAARNRLEHMDRPGSRESDRRRLPPA